MRDSYRMLDEVRRIRREVERGVYSEAISAARTATLVEQKQELSGFTSAATNEDVDVNERDHLASRAASTSRER